MRISVDAARAFYAHPSQSRHSMVTPEELPADGVEYWAEGGVCMALHNAMWPGVWMAHVAAHPAAWGSTVEPCRRILTAFSAARSPDLIVAWFSEANRAVASLARRVGFVEYGRMTMPGGTVICAEWR